VAARLLVIDGAFFSANMSKVVEGGYVPLLLAIAVYGVMWIWHRGAASVQARLDEAPLPVDAFVAELQSRNVARVPGVAVFLTRAKRGTPPVLVWHVKQNRSLHEFVVILTIAVVSTPRAEPQKRLTLSHEAPKFWRVELRYGFMEHPDVPAALVECKMRGCEINLHDVTYYIGHETIMPREDGRGLPRWQEKLFAAMSRNAGRISDYLKLPNDHVVEIGRQISI
jgi:KUP system potassium uptake protein